MAEFAGYEAFEEFHRGALTTVWKARRRGGAEAQIFCVKVYRPPVWEAEEAAAAAGKIDDFLDSVDEQRVLAERGAEHWIPILAKGRTDDEGFAVSRFFPRSLERVIEGRTDLQPEDIQWLALSIASALHELQRELDRPHGNVQPGNVFIDSDGRVSGSKVLLGDLKPRRDLDLAADRTADFSALGRTIVHLARRQHANLQAAIGWPLEAGPEWRRFGRDGVHWRNLCNLLLNPHPEEVRQDWGYVIERIRSLKARSRRPWLLIGAIAVPVAAACLGLGYLMFADYASIPRRFQGWAETMGNVPPDTAEVPPEWGELCLAYNDWLGEFMRFVEDRAVSADWMRQPHLRDRVLGELLDVKNRFGSLSPRDLASVTGDLEALRLQPPDVVKKGQIAFKVREAAHAVARAQAGNAAWPDRARLLELAGRFEQLGWPIVAAEIRGAATAAATDAITAESLNAVSRLAQAAPTTEALWAELERRAGILAGAGDPVMGGILPYLAVSAATSADLPALNRALADATQDTERWLDLVRGGPGGSPRFDRARFAEESELRGFSGPVTALVLAQWERAVAGFMYVSGGDDPRRTADYWNGLFRPIDEAITAIRDEERAGLAAGAAAALQASRDEIRRSIDALLARSIVRRDIGPLTGEVSGLVDSLGRLDREAREAYVRIAPRPADWFALIRRTAYGAEGSALRSEWELRREQFLAGISAAALERNKAEFRDLRARYLELDRFFAELAGTSGVGSLAVLDTAGIPEPLAASLQGWATARVDRAVRGWLEQSRWNGKVPAETAAAMLARAELRAVTEAHAAAMRDAARFGRELGEFDARLAGGAGTDDPAVVAIAAWRAHPVYPEWKDLARIATVLGRADLLARLEAETRVQELLAAASSPILGHAWTAWRRLGAIQGWPGAIQLDDESRIAADLQRRIGQGGTDGGRAAAMQAEIQRELPRRWRVALRSATDDASVRRVAERRDAFGVNEADLTAEERFNLELLRIKQTDWSGLTPDQMAVARTETVARVQTLFTQTTPPEVAAWLKRLSDLQLATGGVVTDVTKLGPGSMAPWTGRTGGDDRRVEFVRTFGARAQRLAFVLVEAEPAAPFYLCTTEMSVGLAIDLTLDRQIRAELRPGLSTAVFDEDGDDRRGGPQTWRLEKDGAIRAVADWAPNPLPTWPKPFYAETVPVPASPTRTAPLQYIPAVVAAQIAESQLGCRLPSPTEWTALVNAGLMRAPEGRVPNLRDGVWQRQRDYMVLKEVLPYQSPIDADIFWPASAGEPKRLDQSSAAMPDRDDGFLWFSDVESPERPGFQHLLGNVAEFLFDADTNRFFVAGGSALSPPDVDPETPYLLEKSAALAGYSDVGIRLAFDAPAALTSRTRLLQLIRNQAYLRL